MAMPARLGPMALPWTARENAPAPSQVTSEQISEIIVSIFSLRGLLSPIQQGIRIRGGRELGGPAPISQKLVLVKVLITYLETKYSKPQKHKCVYLLPERPE